MTPPNHFYTVCDVLAEMARDDLTLVMIAPGEFKLMPRAASSTRLRETIKSHTATRRTMTATEDA